MSFTHLSTTERSELYKLRVIEQLSMTEIGRRMKRNKSTISRELSRNTDERQIGYLPDTADALMQARRKQAKVKFQSISDKTIGRCRQKYELDVRKDRRVVKIMNQQPHRVTQHI